MTPQLIEFHADRPDLYPAPYPAGRAVPPWLKDMPTERPLEKQTAEGLRTVAVPSVKQCPPFIDAMACGYVIPLAGDVTFEMGQSGGLRFRSQGKLVDAQHPLQVKGSPFEGMVIVKFINPWVVRTPPGYSTLFLPPLNQFQTPFQVLSGLVETDTYYRPVHFPTVCLMRPGQGVTLERGTPIAQVVPVLREQWQSQARPWDAAARQAVEQQMKADRHNFYKDRHWVKKGYG